MDAEVDVSKLETVPSDCNILELKTTILKNMTIIEPVTLINGTYTVLENSDGNIEIKQIQNFDDIVQAGDEVDEGTDEDANFVKGEENFTEGDSLLNQTLICEKEVVGSTEPSGEDVDTEELSSEMVGNFLVDEDECVDDPTYEDINEKIAKDVEPKACNICDREFITAASLKRHITVCHTVEQQQDDPLTFQLCPCCGEPIDSAHTLGDLKCDSCDKLFFMQTNLDRHKALEHTIGDTWPCPECALIFTERSALLEHIPTHPLNKIFSCLYCNREFTRKYHLDRHIAQTGCDGTPRNEFRCQVCDKVFSRKDNLRGHLRCHTGENKKKKLIACQYCNKEFRGYGMLVVHIRTHTGDKPYPCDLCPKRFPSSGAMKKHRRMHTGEKPYECPKCSNRFAAKETLNRHVRTHTGNKPHACQFCGKTFIQATQLRAHIFHHTGENAYTCSYCNRAFNRRTRLTMHVRFVHQGEKPMECDQCEKTFFRKEDLARHKLLHSGLKPYECETCHKRFSIKSSLKIHMLTHRKEQPCSCDECGRAFIRQDCLLRHMRAKHRDVLEDIMAGAEKKRLQQQLLSAALNHKEGNESLMEHTIWNELTLTDSVKELLTLLVDEATLESFGWPDAPVDKLLDSVIRRCGHKPASEEDFDYIGRMRENAKLLFTVVIDDEAVKSLLNNQTVDEVILHVLKLAKSD
ncbi:hypothetical protein FQA39_LY03442 [Lamprigera yunnana]|nr:hypothetical protein FQA39_LY03442 [Lamprigera yunnana]